MARKKEFDEDQVLDKAVALFWEKGYGATSANDLVECLGLSRSSLYDTFGDKRSLFLKALQQYRKKVIGEMISYMNNATNIRDTLEALFEIIIEQDIEAENPKGCLMVNTAIEFAAYDREIEAIVNLNQRDVEQSLELALERAKHNGQLRASYNPNTLAKFFYNSIRGIRVAVKSKQDRSALDEIVKVSLSVLDY